MLYGLLITLFVFICFLLILLVLIQKSKSSLGLGSLGGSSQMLFGGSGGQDLFQRATWILGAVFMGGSLVLAIMKKPTSSLASRLADTAPAVDIKVPQMPAQASTPAAE